MQHHRMFWAGIIGMGALLLSGCDDRRPLSKLEGFAQGTTYAISVELPPSVKLETVNQAVKAEFARIDQEFSNYRDDSAIERFNTKQTTEPQTVSEELVSMIETARTISQKSQGCYDLTVKPLFDLWGFKANTFTPPSDDQIQSTLANVGMDKLETLNGSTLRKQRPDLRVDLSSIAQGHTSVRLAQILEEFGVKNYLIEVGGELQLKGLKPDGTPWRVAIEKPLPNQQSLHKIASFDSGMPLALVTSGTYRHYFDEQGTRYSHIIDARTGKPIQHNTVSVVVIHPDSAVADAWATALLCVGSEQGLRLADENLISALFIDEAEGSLVERQSRSLQGSAMVRLIDPEGTL
ncbi:MAG: FAD:protein FMN transferase [Cellvibrio sp.]